MTLASTQHDPARELAFVDLMHRQRARAIIVAGGRLDGGRSDAELLAAIEEYRKHGGAWPWSGSRSATCPRSSSGTVRARAASPRRCSGSGTGASGCSRARRTPHGRRPRSRFRGGRHPGGARRCT
ncbi:hypothetical protein NKG05_06830 [Oerskovia sp. M15]